MTFEELVKIEPKLNELLVEAQNYKRTFENCGCALNCDNAWNKELKPRLKGLVGWFAQSSNKEIHSSWAYDIAFHKIYGALPGCNECPHSRDLARY